MGWESNDFDYMDPNSGGGYSADEGEFDFGNGGNSVNWDFGSTPDMSWDQFQNPEMYQPWQQEQLPGYDQTNENFLGGAAAQNFAPQQQGPSAQDFLGRLFSNPSFLAKGIGALFEGQQNKKMAKKLGQVASNPAMDPFGSQRPFYQQQLQQSVTNPYDSPMVKAQVSNMQRMQDIKDAAAGRRSNNLSSAPGVLATQGAIAQNYMNNLMAPAGANLRPDSGSIAQALSGAAKYDVNGSISPLIRAIQGGINSQELMDLFNTRKA